jgi:hypothetical protein
MISLIAKSLLLTPTHFATSNILQQHHFLQPTSVLDADGSYRNKS